jgi:hypothetical protein
MDRSEYMKKYRRDVKHGRPRSRVDATGTHRRIQALVVNGWTFPKLSARMGEKHTAKVVLDHKMVELATAEKIARLYDELWDQKPVAETLADHSGIARAKQLAHERGWVGPMSWDDDEIDDPAAKPRRMKPRTTRSYAVTLEEVEHFSGFGMSEARIAERLGIDTETIAMVRRRVAA